MLSGQNVIFAFRQKGKICIQAKMQELPAGVEVKFAFRQGVKDARGFSLAAHSIKITIRVK